MIFHFLYRVRVIQPGVICSQISSADFCTYFLAHVEIAIHPFLSPPGCVFTLCVVGTMNASPSHINRSLSSTVSTCLTKSPMSSLHADIDVQLSITCYTLLLKLFCSNIQTLHPGHLEHCRTHGSTFVAASYLVTLPRFKEKTSQLTYAEHFLWHG